MAQTLTRVLVHFITSTKERQPFITPDIEPALHRYIGGIARNLDSPCLAIGGDVDHFHALISLSKNISLANLALNLKRDSSRWIKAKGGAMARFRWQDGYSTFSIGEAQVETLKRYIARQHEHHRKVSFQDELRIFLRKYKMEYDERYIWL